MDKDAIKASQTATEGGRKFDGGKVRYGLLPPLALKATADVLTFGAEKYEPDNWKHVPDSINRYFDAAQRHMWAYQEGEAIDPDSERYLSEDYMFCQWWRKIGGQIFLCPWMKTQHIGTYAFSGNMPKVAELTGKL